MKKLAWFSAALLAAACGGDDGGGANPDAGEVEFDAEVEADAEVDERDITDVTTAYSENEDGGFDEVGPANWDCLSDPDDVEPTENPITVSGRVTEFQDNDLEDVEVAVFDSTNFFDAPIAGPVEAVDPGDGEDGLLYEGLEVPAGVTRVAFRITTSETLTTISFGNTFEPQAEDVVHDLSAFAEATAAFLAAVALGGERSQGLGIVAGDVLDCDGNVVRHAVGALSTTSGELVPYEDSERTFYFGSLLPNPNATETAANGRLMIPEIEPSEDPLYVQVWGYPNQEAFDNEELVLLSEFETAIPADGLLTGALRPLVGESE